RSASRRRRRGSPPARSRRPRRGERSAPGGRTCSRIESSAADSRAQWAERPTVTTTTIGGVPRPEWGSDALACFLELAALPSPPGEERAAADRVLGYLEALGLGADEDDAGAKVGSTVGNIYARLEPNGGAGAPLFFCAHLDTVLPEGPIEPEVGEDEVVRNSAGTILGADNKSAVASMLEAAGGLVGDVRP